MNNQVMVNGKEFSVRYNEFNKIHHNEFNCLNILDGLGWLERLVSVLNELRYCMAKVPDNNSSIILINAGHGGYVATCLSTVFENVAIQNGTSIHNENIYENIKRHYCKNIELHNTQTTKEKVFDVTCILSCQSPVEIGVDYIPFSPLLVCPENLNEELTEWKDKQCVEYVLKDSSHKVVVSTGHDGGLLHKVFVEVFYYYLDLGAGVLAYDNLIHFTMIVKNGGEQLRNVLQSNLPFIDRWTILDTGSTDNTISIINEVLVGKKKGELHCEPFIDFKQSRNKCLDLAGTNCKFIVMLDDTYTVKNDLRNFLNVVRGDQFSTSFSLFINSSDVSYSSNRVTKSASGHRYIYRIHEVISPIGNVNVIIPITSAFIFDARSDYMETRTMDRKLRDIEMLKMELEDDPDDPRALYYLGQTHNVLGNFEESYKYYLERVAHPVQGFLQEKIDASFESARMACFKLNKPWEHCENLFNITYEMDKTRSDPLYFIGIHYYLENDMEKAHTYFKRCFQLGYPEHCQYSLKPTLHNYYNPKFLATTSYMCKDFDIGFACSNHFLKTVHPGNPYNECYNIGDVKTLTSWNCIYKLLVEIPNVSRKPTPTIARLLKYKTKPFLVFMEDGGFNKWSGSTILKRGVGGAETFTIEMARHIQRQGVFQVIVFCKCEFEEVFEGVEYIQIEEFFPFSLIAPTIHTCIIGRYSEYYPYALECPSIERIYLIAHDLEFTGNVFPNQHRLKKIFCLSEWHVEYFGNIFQDLKPLLHAFGYGIDPVQHPLVSTGHKFIYSSFPIRGLLPLLQMWLSIKNKYPKATLHIHSNIDDKWSNDMRPELMKTIRNLLKELTDTPNGIVYRGWTSKEELMKTWASADVCFYPCTYLETFCHTILEAGATKTLVITTDIGALPDTLGDRGVFVKGCDLGTDEGRTEALRVLFDVLDNPKQVEMLVERHFEWCARRTWADRARDFVNILEDVPPPAHVSTVTEITEPLSLKHINLRLDYAGMYNWTNDVPCNTHDTFIEILDYVKWKTTRPLILEVGTFAGTSIIKMLEHFKQGSAIVIDRWKNYPETVNGIETTLTECLEESGVKSVFDENIRMSGLGDRVTVIENDSAMALLNLSARPQRFDFIYIDGSHMLADCLIDLILSFNVLKVGGVCAIDDYLLNTGEGLDKLSSPYIAVNKFLEKYGSKIKVLHKRYRVFYEKMSM